MKLTNGKETMLDDLQEGIKRAYPTLKHVAGTRGFINRNFKDEIVPLISGGGSGHDPAHWGFVGDGMPAGAVSGELFVPPTAKEIIEVTQKLTSKKRVFYIVKNFERDVDEFCKARLFWKMQGGKSGWRLSKTIYRWTLHHLKKDAEALPALYFSIRSWGLMRKMAPLSKNCNRLRTNF